MRCVASRKNCHRLWRFVRARQQNARGQQVIGAEAGVHRDQVREAANQQSRPRQQHHRKREFQHHQKILKTSAAGCGAACARRVFQRVGRSHAGAEKRGRHSEDHRRGERNQGRECDHPGVDCNRGHPRKVDRRLALDHGHAPHGQQQAQAASQGGQQGAFGKQLAGDPPRSRAQRSAYGHLAAARSGPREQQVRHVGAGDQQHQAHRTQQHIQRAAVLAGYLLSKIDQPDAPALAEGRVVLLGARRDAVHLRLRLCQRDAGLQPCDGAQIPPGALVVALRVHEIRQPVFRLGVEEFEPARHDPDDRVRLAIQIHGAAQRRGVGLESLLPESMAEDNQPVLGARFVLGKSASQRGFRAQQGEEIRRHQLPVYLLGLGDARQVADVGSDRGNPLEDRALCPPVKIIDGPDHVVLLAAAWKGIPDHHQPPRLPIRQRRAAGPGPPR